MKKFGHLVGHKNRYSIYYGIISKYISNDTIEDPTLQEKIDAFMEAEKDLVTMEDMQNCYRAVDKSNMSELYSRLYSITRNKQRGINMNGVDMNDGNTR